jgi:hypothetical protein
MLQLISEILITMPNPALIGHIMVIHGVVDQEKRADASPTPYDCLPRPSNELGANPNGLGAIASETPLEGEDSTATTPNPDE